MTIINTSKEAALTAERLRGLFGYNPLTGILSRRFPFRVIKPCSKTGYMHANIDGFNYFVHRLAWLHFYGRWPIFILDHINGIKSDNRISNLREATRIQNRANQGPRGGRKFKGITFADGLWQAQIGHNGKNLYLGRYSSPEEAAAVYAAKAIEIHGEFAVSP